MLAEDDAATRTAIERALELEGYDVVAEADGEAALATILATEPDLALLDLMMPRRDGLEVCRALRRGGSRIPILLLTARGRGMDCVLGLDAGADDYLAKPFALEELLAVVRALLRRTGSDDEEIVVGDLRIDPPARRGLAG